jgi:hypothetical protein
VDALSSVEFPPSLIALAFPSHRSYERSIGRRIVKLCSMRLSTRAEV